MAIKRLTLRTLSPRSGVVLPCRFAPIFPRLGLLLAELRHRGRSAVLGGVGLPDVPSPFSPGLRRSVWETGLSSSRETLNVVRRAVLLCIEVSETLSPLSPALARVGHASGLRVVVLLRVEVAEALTPFGPSYEKGKLRSGALPYRGQRYGRKSYFGVGREVAKEREWERQLGCWSQSW